jgi:pteridine reductase
VALVTGGAVRIGRAIGGELARSGCDIVVHYHGSVREAKAAVAELRGLGVRAAAIRADLSRPAEIRGLFARALARMGRLDYLIGNAATFRKVPFARTDSRVWDAAMAVNARANFLLARAAAAELRKRRGRIVVITDLAARFAWRDYAAHGVSKAAAEAVVRVLARELAPFVSVNGVAPGTVLPPAGMARSDVDRLRRRIPMARIGSPSDVAEAVRFFCEGPAYVTGQILAVDGGRSTV